MADEQAHAMRAAHDDPSIVDRLCAPDELLATALGIADSYAANPDRQLRMTKTLLAGNLAETDLALVQAREQRLLTECWASPEHAEAIDAFLTKRPAVFRPTDATQ